jgi:hypothetical protein
VKLSLNLYKCGSCVAGNNLEIKSLIYDIIVVSIKW